MPDMAMAAEAAPLNYFLHSDGPASLPTMHLGWVFTAVVVAVLAIIALLLAGALFRKRTLAAPRTVGRENEGMRWIYIGTGLSTAALFALAVYMLITLDKVAQPTQTPALAVTVTAYDWWWKVEYDDDDPSRRFVTANEIHIPVGRPVRVRLQSADVIHAFWAPRLAGKTQMIPGLQNRQWLQADAEGIYRGQCVQFCGLQHAHMGFEIVAQSPVAFQAWQDAQRKAAAPASEPDVAAGRKFFIEQCAGCHSVRGTEAGGKHAPDLTHLNSRRMLAAGLLTNTAEHRIEWITRVQALKPGARMPAFALTPGETAALSAFLSTLD
ncbi:cytochrome c oxidase subunit II [Methylomicrobium album]|nr:c-type cytochrome [Methylomicrobium album]